MSYYDALVAKWATLAPGTTAEKLTALNAPVVDGPVRPVQISEIAAYLRSQGAWLAIKDSAAQYAAELANGSIGAAAAVDLNDDLRMQTVDMTLPIVVGMLADLVAHTLLTQAQADALVAMGKTLVPWWQVNGYARAFDLGDINAAGLV